jgi:acetolactate synthase I/II/III large subunit
MKASDFIIRFLKDHGIDIVFGYSGGAITHLMDSLNKENGIRFIQTYSEQTAAIAAEGYQWTRQLPGVAIATSGPGATNLITGIADAYFDSIPTLFITGQVNTFEYKNDKPIRQQGFQETDIVAIVRSITKYAVLVSDPLRIRFELEKAWSIATSGRRGPVLLDIPMDVQRAIIDESALESYQSTEPSEEIRYLADFSRESLSHLLEASQRPIILLGGGANSPGTKSRVKELVRKMSIPVVVSLLGKGAFAEDDDLFLGMIGSYGNRCANMAVANSDLLIAIGSRLDTRQTGTNLPSFLRSGKVVRLDIDEHELSHHRLRNTLCAIGDSQVFVKELCSMSRRETPLSWRAYLSKIKKLYGQDAEILRNIENPKPYQVMDVLNRFADNQQLYTVDIGQNQMFAAQKIVIRATQLWRTSGGLAPMGFSLPAAIGAAFGNEMKKQIYAITGDGGLQMSLQSLLLISQYHLPIKIILLNNKSLGMITQFQDLYFDKRKEGTTKEGGYLVPDFRLLSQACNLKYHLVHESDYEDSQLLQEIFQEPGPSLIEFDVGELTVVYPKLEVNRPIEEISPLLPRDELASNMLIKIMDQG